MAKSTVPGLDRVRDLFTSTERAVLESTAGRALLEASRKQLAAALAQARTLRDKWRDLHTSQARATKRTAAGGGAANARSRDKSDMFTAAVERVQARLAELGVVPAAGKGFGTAAVAKRPTKAARVAGHRTARAGVKGTLAARAAAINRTAAPAVKPAPRTAPPATAAKAVTTKAGTTKAARKTARAGKRPAAVAAAAAPAANQRVRFDVTKQRSAKASANAARLKLDGKVTRRAGHALVAGKRRQAARDRRGR